MSEQSHTVRCVNDNSWQSTLQDLGHPLLETTFVVLDLETTGAGPHIGAAITEIGAVKVKAGKTLGEFETFINPGHPIPDYIQELTGINDSMVHQAPSISTVLPSLFEFLGSHHYARVHDFQWPAFVILDTAIIARKVLTRDEVPNCKLGTLAAFFGTQTTPNHRALDDARATVDVLHGLIERLGSFDIYTLEELHNFGKKVKKPKSGK